MKNIFFILWVSLSILGCDAPTNSPEKENRPPNVILILTDDQGSLDMGAYGVKDLLTPNMDRLAAKGIRFTQFYAGAPVCSPSRASLLTGKTPQAAGVPGNVGDSPSSKRGLQTQQVLIPEMLKPLGYKTAHIGKWHLGFTPEMIPNGQGFDYSFGHMVGCIDNYSHFFYWHGPNRHDLYLNGKEIYRDGEYFPDMMVDEAKRFISENQKDPFFIYFALNTPHYPYQGDEKWLTHYNEQGVEYPRNLYNAFVSSTDDRIGQLMDHVEALGLTGETIIIFQSDHGHSTEERAHFGGGFPGPYRGAKFSLFEGGIRVPAVISWPGHLAEGEVRDQLAVAADWMPTLAELCGASVSEGIDGKSLVPILKSKDAADNHDVYHWESGGNRWAVRKGKWKLLYDPRDTSTSHQAPENAPEDMVFLVDLEADIGEKQNIALEHPEIVNELTALHDQWKQSLAP